MAGPSGRKSKLAELKNDLNATEFYLKKTETYGRRDIFRWYRARRTFGVMSALRPNLGQ